MKRQRGLISAGLLPKRPQWLELNQSEGRIQELPSGLQMGAGTLDFGSSSTASPVHKQGAGRGVEQLGDEPVST